MVIFIETYFNNIESINFQKDNQKLSDRYELNKSRFVRNKTPEEIKFLEDVFIRDPKWSRKTVQYCKERLNLGTTQIYKWGFDK